VTEFRRVLFRSYRNAFGLMLPFLSYKFKGPSFLNTNPETGHIHRRRSQTLQKAIDYVNIILIKHKLAGDHFKGKAVEVINLLKPPLEGSSKSPKGGL
jgi:hypothetical protein